MRSAASARWLANSVVAAALVLAGAGTAGAADTGAADWRVIVDAAVAAATARPTPMCAGANAKAWPELTLAEGRVVGADLLREIGGYAGAAHTTGGLGGRLVIVTTPADYNSDVGETPIPGSLRAAVDGARADGAPAWIVFDPALGPAARIEIKTTLRPPDNVTLDGTCADVTLESPDNNTILAYLDAVHNVIVARLAFHKTGYVPELHPDDDSAIRVHGDVDRIAILHNDLSECGDGCIDITTSPRQPPPGRARITVAYNFIHDHDKVMLLGTFTCAGEDGDQCDRAYFDANRDAVPGFFLTLDGNLFLRTGQRHPRAYGRVSAHIVNNVEAFQALPRPGGRLGGTYGIFVSDDARALIEHNLFIPAPPQRKIPLAAWTVLSPAAMPMLGDVEGFIRLRANAVVSGAIAAEDRPGLVPEPPYAFRTVPLADLPPKQALACVADRAGRAGAARWSDTLCAPVRN